MVASRAGANAATIVVAAAKSDLMAQGTLQSNEMPEKASSSQFTHPFSLVCF